MLTAFKPGPDQTAVLRLYEAAGQPAPSVTIQFHVPLAEPCEANLLEDTGRKLTAAGQSVSMPFHRFEIKTLKVRLGPP